MWAFVDFSVEATQQLVDTMTPFWNKLNMKCEKMDNKDTKCALLSLKKKEKKIGN